VTSPFEQNDKANAPLPSVAKEATAKLQNESVTEFEALDKSNSQPAKTQKSSEVLPSPSKVNTAPQNLRDSPPDRPAPTSSPDRAPIVDQKQPLAQEFHNDPAILQSKGIGNFVETSQNQSPSRSDEGVKPSLGDEPGSQRVQDSTLIKVPLQPSLLPESLTAPPRKDAAGSLLITPLDGQGFSESRRADSIDTPVARVKSVEGQPQSSSPQISLGELAARLNQGDTQKPALYSSSSSEPISARTHDGSQSSEKSSLSTSENLRSSVSNETAKPISNSIDQAQHREVAPASPAAQAGVAATEKTVPAALSPTLLGQISNTRDSAHDVPGAAVANAPGSASPDRPVTSDRPKNDVDPRARIDTNSTERQAKGDVGKIETIDARTNKADGSAMSSSASDLVKGNRTETFSTDKAGKTDKVDATKLNDGMKSRAEISNQTKREPLIIPGVITSRTSDSGKGGKGSKTDDSGKSDTTKVDGKKVDGGAAGIKNGGTASDALSGRKNNIKTDKSDEKADQRADTKIAASTSNVISGVAGRIVDSLSTIKDKLIPGAKPNVDSRTEKADGRPEFANHSAQPKPMDASLGIGRDLKPNLPSSTTEFVYNGKKPLSDSREDTLSSKTGGLKQALLQIFGNHPDIAADLKANIFPGPKTVPFENAQGKPGDRQTAKAPDRADKPSDTEVSKKVDPAYLRNQRGDRVPTGNLREELAELKTNPELTKSGADFDIETEGLAGDSTNRQQIVDFTVQLGEIAIGAASVQPSEFFTADDTIEEAGTPAADEDVYDSRYLYYVKEGDTLRSIFDSQLPHEIGNTAAFEYFVKINEQTIRLASVLSADSMSFILQPGTVLKLPTPRQLAQLNQ
jgi:hypothetical protein